MSVRLYVLTVTAIGAAGVAQAIRAGFPASIDPLMLAILIGLAAVTQRMPVFLFRSSAISISFAAVIASYVLYGTGIGVLVSLFQAAVNAFTPTRKPLVKAAFNAGSLSTSAFVAGEIFRLVAPERGDIAATLLAVGASAAGYFLVNTALTAGVIAISERQSFFSVWRTNYAWMPLNFLATAAQGAALALASQALGVFGVLVFTLPLAVAWYSFRLYMSKSHEVRARNAELQSVNDMLKLTNDRLEESHLSVIGALMGALEAKENARAEDAAATMANAVAVAERLGLADDEIAAIKLGALFHDIGTIGVPEHLLRKPGALDEQEWGEVRAHATIGANLLSNVPMLERVRPIVQSHHERYDGTGYPMGLKEDQIPLAAQIIAVADAFQAMTAERPYRGAMSSKEALRELRANAGTQFNPVVVEAFIAAVTGERKSAAQVTQTKQIFQQALEAVRARAS
ncbi:MAG: HD-GYP domain-containing protein [Candidatus Limnocylindria bacterium]|nr:HD-GYP domain-containing protein [Candidatus Limnocylindria bacterium]